MEWYKKIANNCRKATFFMEKKKFSAISPLQQIELRIHLFGCSVCRLYDRQSWILDGLLRQYEPGNVPQDQRLSDEFKKALEVKLAQQTKRE